MAGSAALRLRELEALRGVRGAEAARRKAGLLRDLSGARLATAAAVGCLHEAVCFLRAYPDDPGVLAAAERLLDRFPRRGDLRRFRADLADSGIAGAPLTYRFFAPTARRIARRFPDRLSIAWGELERPERLTALLYLLAPYCESPPPDEMGLGPRRWMARLARPGETDAAFLIRRIAALPMAPGLRDHLYEDLDLPIRIAPGPATPSRTRARHAGSPVVFRSRPLDRARPDLRRAARLRPLAIREAPRREAEALVELARDAMLTRARDLDVFAQADPLDVRMIDWGEGFQLACMGAVPEGRFLLEAVYGFLMLQSGVPIGYVLASALNRSSEIAYNVFETFRGGEAARNYGRVIATVRALFGSDSFAIDPYQLGHRNDEAIGSGAFWFYRKLGFAPADAARRGLLRAEEARLRDDPAYRSGRAALRRLANGYVFFHLGRPRDDVLGKLRLDRVGMRVTEYLAGRFGSGVDAGIDRCAAEAASLLGAPGWRGWPAGERACFRRWSPLVLSLGGVERWSPEERRDAVALIRAKGGRRESEFVPRFQRHRRLRGAILRIAAAGVFVSR